MRLFCLLLIAFCVGLGGCSSNPWTYQPPPGNGVMAAESALKPVILLGEFTSSNNIDVRFSDVAPQMQKAFSRALLKSGRYEVVNDSLLAQQAEDALDAYGNERTQLLQEITHSLGTTNAYVIQGRITDFLHTKDAPESVRRLSWFEEANDALVAVDLTAVGLQKGRTIYSNQLVATAATGNEISNQYGDLEFGSYLFWSTPLGKASKEVIDEAVEQLALIRGATPGIATIAAYEEGGRAVEVQGGNALEAGGIYYLGVTNPSTGQYVSVDDDLGRPLRVRIEKGYFGGCTGWLLSEPASYEIVSGTTLAKAPFPTQLSPE